MDSGAAECVRIQSFFAPNLKPNPGAGPRTPSH